MKNLPLIALSLLLLAGCGGTGDSIDIPSEAEDLVASFDKEDTGYLSDQATEIEGTFTGYMDLDLSAISVEERDQYVAAWSAITSSTARTSSTPRSCTSTSRPRTSASTR
jgi:hypothetical protein